MKVTTQCDICLNLIVPCTATHDFIPLPPVPPVPPPMPAAPLSLAACAFEIPVNAWWPPGYALGANKFTTTVFHMGMGMCLDGHDCGKLIIHVQMFPGINNMLTLVQIPLSARKCNFTASTVKMDGKTVACMLLFALPPSPMTYCADPMSMPLAGAPTANLNSVTVGMTFGDWFAGAIAIAAGMLLDWFIFKKFNGGTRGFGQRAGKVIAQSRAGRYVYQIIAGKIVGELPSLGAEWALKQSVGFATGMARILLTGEGEAGVTISAGGPFAEIKIGAAVTHNNDTGWGGKGGVSGQLLTASGSVDTGGASIANNHPLGLGSEEHKHDWATGDNTSTNTDVSEPFNGFHNRTTTTKNGQTTVADSRQPPPTSNPL